MVSIKFWAKETDICKCDCISSYGWTLLFISFLQTLKLPNGDRLVPSVNDLQRGFPPNPRSLINGWRTDFQPKQNFVLLPNEPQFSHFGLLKGFFNYYKSFAFEENIVCPYLGQPIPWSSLVGQEANVFPLESQWYQNQMQTLHSSKAVQKLLRQNVSIQDPFQHDFLLGGNCSKKKFERIVKCLDAAVRVCQTEDELGDPNASNFLTSLFTSPSQGQAANLKIKIREIPGVQIELLLEQVCVTLENIFTKIMKFDIKPLPIVLLRPRGEPETKVVKKTETQDVHQLNDVLRVEKKYNCAAVHPVWYCRKKSRKEVKLSYPETAFEFEVKLSDVIVNHNYPSERVEFTCEVQIGKSLVLEVILKETSNQHSEKIKDVFDFLRNNLRVWVNAFLREEFLEPAVSGRTLHLQAEPCTSNEDIKVAAEREDSENGDAGLSFSESGTACEDSNSSLDVVDQKENGDHAVKEN